jgi:hypothetical protein
MVSRRMNSNDLTDALQLLEGALQIMDDSDAPGHIGAHLDLALCQLREHLGTATFDQPNLIREEWGFSEAGQS